MHYIYSYPAEQIQAEGLTLPLGDVALLPHGVQLLSAFPIALEYEPSVQFVHAILP